MHLSYIFKSFVLILYEVKWRYIKNIPTAPISSITKIAITRNSFNMACNIIFKIDLISIL